MSMGRRPREPPSAISPSLGADSPCVSVPPPTHPSYSLDRFDQYSQFPVESPSGDCSGPVDVLFTVKSQAAVFHVGGEG